MIHEEETGYQTRAIPFFTGVAGGGRVIGILRDHEPHEGVVLLSPAHVARLTEKKIEVVVERGLGEHAGMSDLDFADAGVSVVDFPFEVILQSQVVAKLTPFSLQEIAFLKNKQVVISTLETGNLSIAYFQHLLSRQITAFALDYIKDKGGQRVMDRICFQKTCSTGFFHTLGQWIGPLLYALSTGTGTRNAIITQPMLMQSLYCFNGIITRADIAQKWHLPYRVFFDHEWSKN
ncbi:MAG: hypothetical protein LBR51_02940 [Bacteroidales bacterium]|jgi:alanine dehydrogenase|nr:hypothetical protein [Bacteroidales bacterium]